MTYSGIIVTWVGSIIVASTITNTMSRPGHLTIANPYATRLHETRVPMTEGTAYSSVFRRAPRKFILEIAFGNAEKSGGHGITTGGDAIDCGTVLNEVLIIHTSGSR